MGWMRASGNTRPTTDAISNTSFSSGGRRSKRLWMMACTVVGKWLAVNCRVSLAVAPSLMTIPSSRTARLASSKNNGLPPVRPCRSFAKSIGSSSTFNVALRRDSVSSMSRAGIGRRQSGGRSRHSNTCPERWVKTTISVWSTISCNKCRRITFDASSLQCQSSRNKIVGLFCDAQIKKRTRASLISSWSSAARIWWIIGSVLIDRRWR